MSILSAEFDIDVARSVWQEEAKEEGKEEEKTETAISMLKDGMDVEIVVKYSRLSREKVLALKATLEIA